ncbi:unnamed protein product [Heligmosomoides polygyrus]|uniref:Uncharacterized protein n=1 Tax=Heligmosomoides polygyrus TaxID=6339 RepID=A0A183FHJ5_HELPZ|nr:unnamed protein product [Heligmosomoides polygyrus]
MDIKDGSSMTSFLHYSAQAKRFHSPLGLDELVMDEPLMSWTMLEVELSFADVVVDVDVVIAGRSEFAQVAIMGDDEGCGAAAAAAASGTDDIDSTSTDDELQQKDALDST